MAAGIIICTVWPFADRQAGDQSPRRIGDNRPAIGAGGDEPPGIGRVGDPGRPSQPASAKRRTSLLVRVSINRDVVPVLDIDEQ